MSNKSSRVLVLVEHDHKKPAPSTPRLITAAQSFDLPVDLVVAGAECHEVAELASRYKGVSRILLIAGQEDLFDQQVEDMATCLHPLLAGEHDIFLATANAAGRELVPVLAAWFDVAPLTDVVQILGFERFVRPVHAGSLLMEVRLSEPKKLMSLRPAGFAPIEQRHESKASAELVHCQHVSLPEISMQVGGQFPWNETALEEASLIIGIGRGAQDEESLLLIEKLAKRLDASLGGTRVAVELGIVPNNEQIGQTGKTIAPKLYIALGISGAVQHLAGIRDAQTIVAINKDPDAPIFKIADYGLVGDLRDLLPDLLAALTSALAS